MANNFDPLKEGAKKVSASETEDFSPEKMGAKRVSSGNGDMVPRETPAESPGYIGQFNAGMGNFAKGLAQGGVNTAIGAADLIPGVNIPRVNWADEDSFAGRVGELGGDVASFFGGGAGIKALSQLPKIANVLSKVASTIRRSSAAERAMSALTSPLGKAVSQNALFGAIENPESGWNQASGAVLGAGMGAVGHGLGKLTNFENPFIRSASGAALGAGAGYGVGSLFDAPIKGAEAGALLGGAPFLRKDIGRYAKQNMLENITPESVAEPMASARRIGVDLKPAEAFNDPYLASRQGSLGTTKEGAEILRRDNLKREAQEEAAIRSLHSSIVPKGTIKRKNELYKASEGHVIPDNALLELRQDPIIENAMRKVKKNRGYAKDIKGFPENSIKFLDVTKRFINDSSAKMRGNVDRSVKLREADNYDSSAKDLTNVLDKYSPEYKEGRQLAEDVISRRKLTLKKGKDRGTVFYKQFLENNPKFEKAMSHLSRNPEAQQKLKDMRLVFERLIGHHNPKAAAGAAKSSTGSPLNRSTPDKMKVILDKLLGSTYDKEAAELITNPKWDDEITKLVKQKDKNKQATELANLLIRVGATTGTAGVSEIKR